MPGKRNARSRVRGSWAARLIGIGLAIVLAGAGIAAYLTFGNKPSHSPGLPTRVLSQQAVGLVSPGPPARAGASPAPEAFLVARSDLSFTAAAGQAGADWTADQMAGGTYIFIYLPNGQCLASARKSAVTLTRCNLEASQRWIRQHLVSEGGLEYGELRNLSSSRCLTAVGGSAAAAPAQSAPRLDRCQASPDWTQLVAFVTAS
jgi:hypothetical protein